MPRMQWEALDVKRFRRDLGLSQYWLGFHMGTTERTVRTWEERGAVPARHMPRLSRLLRTVNEGGRLKGHGTHSQPGRPLKHPLYE